MNFSTSNVYIHKIKTLYRLCTLCSTVWMYNSFKGAYTCHVSLINLKVKYKQAFWLYITNLYVAYHIFVTVYFMGFLLVWFRSNCSIGLTYNLTWGTLPHIIICMQCFPILNYLCSLLDDVYTVFVHLFIEENLNRYTDNGLWEHRLHFIEINPFTLLYSIRL